MNAPINLEGIASAAPAPAVVYDEPRSREWWRHEARGAGSDWQGLMRTWLPVGVAAIRAMTFPVCPVCGGHVDSTGGSP